MSNSLAKKLVSIALTVAFVEACATASGKKIWAVDITRLSYRSSQKRTIVRWQNNYVVIGALTFVPDENTRQCVQAFDPLQPMLVFDVINRKRLPKEALGAFVLEWEPPRSQRNFYPCKDDDRYMPTAPFLTYEMFYGHGEKNLVVYDTNWKEKYRVSPAGVSCWDICVTSNRTGTRFAILNLAESLAAKIRNKLTPFRNEYYTDTKAITVFSAQDGQKLFEHSWREAPSVASLELGNSERVAFSDDGEMLAVLTDDGKLQVYKIANSQ